MNVVRNFEKLPYIKTHIEHFDVYHTNLGGYRYRKDDSPSFYLNGAFHMYEIKQGEIEILEDLLSTALKKLNKYERTKHEDDLESLRWTLESL